MAAEYLDWALADFSGYLAADELDDGPFCVLSTVDARRQRRLLSEVLDHNPTQLDILSFLARLHDQIKARGPVVRGLTTDASPLYPLSIALALGDVPHQVCEFHILKERTKAVRRVVARLRKRLASEAPKLPRGRTPKSAAARRQPRRARALRQRVTERFDERHLFVRHHLTAEQRAALRRLTGGQPHLRALRAIRDEV
jgi:hypothetical protein